VGAVFSDSHGDYPLEVVTPHASGAARHATAVSFVPVERVMVGQIRRVGSANAPALRALPRKRINACLYERLIAHYAPAPSSKRRD